jgi:O-antigen/teichoic acid export membrane protein
MTVLSGRSEAAVQPLADTRAAATSAATDAPTMHQGTQVAGLGGALGTNILIMSCGAVSSVWSARLFGPAGRGELAAGLAWGGVVAGIGLLGLDQAVPYVIARRDFRVGDVFVTALTFCALLVIPLFAASWWLIGYSFGSSSIGNGAHIYLLALPTLMVTPVLSGCCLGAGHLIFYNTIRGTMAAALPLTLLFLWSTGVHDAVAALKVFTLGSTLLMVILIIGFVWLHGIRGRCRRDTLSALWEYGWKAQLGNISWIINGRLDQLLLSLFVGAGNLGLYAVAVSYSTVVTMVGTSYGPLLLRDLASDRAGASRHLLQSHLRRGLIFVLLSGLALGVSAPYLFPLVFGDRFRSAILVTEILIVANGILAINVIAVHALRGCGKPLKATVADFAGLVVTLGGLLFALPRWGILGAAIVSLISYGVMTSLTLGALRDITVQRKPRLFVSN